MTPHPVLRPRTRTPGSRDRHLSGLIAVAAVRALLEELATWPKPGLVSHVDNGSHDDMDAAMLQRSAEVLGPFFEELAQAGSDHDSMASLREIGLRAEAAMLTATAGVNTHRGTIFGLGLLCAAAGLKAARSLDGKAARQQTLGAIVSQHWGHDIRRGPIPIRRYGAGGARLEAASGFPSIYAVALPALHHGSRIARNDKAAAHVQACFALIATVGDTNLLHRGGAEGALYAREAAATFLREGGVGASDWREQAASVHAGFVARRLSPGGCADLLAMTLFVDALQSGSFWL
jgi:triphosphoribosyl-dephospho-CoA synthase